MIRPALAAGKTIVSDRYLLANLVYQGHAGGLDVEAIRRVGAVAIDGIRPDAVFLLDMPPAAADSRLRRTLDRMERQGDDYRERLRAGFLAEAARRGKSHPRDRCRSTDRRGPGRDSRKSQRSCSRTRIRLSDSRRDLPRPTARMLPVFTLRVLDVERSANRAAAAAQRVIDGFLQKL